MPGRPTSSRIRFLQYKHDLKSRRLGRASTDGQEAPSVDATLPTDVRPKSRRRNFLQLLREFWGLLEGFHTRLVFALFTASVATVLTLIPPYATKLVIDHVIGDKPMPAIIQEFFRLPSDRPTLLAVIAIAIVGISLSAILVGIVGRWQATKTNVQLKPRLRRQIFEHTLRLPLHRVYQLKTGGTASILREDTGSIGELIFGLIYNPWKAIIQLTGSLLILAFVDWRLLIGSLLIMPMVWLTHRTWINRIRPLYRDMHATRQTIDSHTTETFGGIRVVRSFGRTRTESARFIRNDQFRARQEAHVWWWSRGVDIAWSVLIPVASAVLLWYGGTQVLKGVLTLGDLVLFLTYLIMLLQPIATLATSATQFQTGLAGLDRVLDLLAEPVEMPDRPGAIAINPQEVAGQISVERIDFTYPGSTAQVLSEINLEVKPGQVIALVGPSGAGKTTMCNLIARFYDPVQGSICLDGTDLRDISLESFRRLLGIVEQDIFLFDGTIAENIGYGRRDASMDRITHFAEQANAHEFINEFEKGYDTIIGERGVKLSGGQRQRLAIARALLADPRILILDEATSNLDTESERLIQQSLHNLMRGRTCFVIAHRLSTIAHADHIVVIDHGRIIEEGTHSDLMARSGRYRHMVQMQTEAIQAVTTRPAEMVT